MDNIEKEYAFFFQRGKLSLDMEELEEEEEEELEEGIDGGVADHDLMITVGRKSLQFLPCRTDDCPSLFRDGRSFFGIRLVKSRGPTLSK